MSEEFRIGQYILVRKIGEGGMAEVWEGRHYLLDTRTAVKFLLPAFARNKELQERFLNEGKRQSQLQHPNIVPALDFFQIEGCSYLVMRYVDGESLESRLEKTREPLSVDAIHAICWDVSSALDYAHSLGVVHRDVKPANMLIDRNRTTQLMDFGIAKALREERSVTLTGTSMGTPDYMSPEQIVDPRKVDARSDVYSFGCVMYAMFTGEPPFSKEGATAFHVQSGHVRETPPPLVYRNPDVPHAVGDVVMKCLEKNPADRYPSCGAAMSALDVILAKGTGGPVTRPAEAKPGPKTVLESKAVTEDSTPPRAPEAVTPPRSATRSSGTFVYVPPAPVQPAPPVESRPGNAKKYLAMAVLLLSVIAGSGYFMLRGNGDRGQATSSKDWSAARYDDAGFKDCRNIQPCLDRKAEADRLRAVHDWQPMRFDDPELQDCMGYAPCTQRAEQAAMLQKTTDWTHADRLLLADCMSYSPCVAASHRLHGVVPVVSAAPPPPAAQPLSLRGRSRSVEDLPTCCSKDNNPRECMALKKQADIADCSSPIGDN